MKDGDKTGAIVFKKFANELMRTTNALIKVCAFALLEHKSFLTKSLHVLNYNYDSHTFNSL